MKYVIIYLLFMLVVLSIILYFVIKHEKYINSSNIKQVTLINDEILMDNIFAINKSVFELFKRDNLKLTNNGNKFIITWKMYIPNVGGEYYWSNYFGRDKTIFKLGNSPHIYYNAKTNTMKLILRYFNSPFMNHYPIIEFDQIEQQKWNTFTIVFDSYNIIVFYNGVEVINKEFENMIELDDHKYSNVQIGEVNNNIFGKISDFKIITNDLTHQQLLKLNM